MSHDLEHSLRTARESFGKDLNGVSLELSIPADALRGLEELNLDALPAECFALGFMRSYCDYLGLPSAGNVARLQALYIQKAHGGSTEFGSFHLRSLIEKVANIPQMVPHAGSWVVATILVLAAWMAYSVVARPSAEHSPTSASAAVIELSLPLE